MDPIHVQLWNTSLVADSLKASRAVAPLCVWETNRRTGGHGAQAL